MAIILLILLIILLLWKFTPPTTKAVRFDPVVRVVRFIPVAPIASVQKKEFDNKQIDEKYKEFEATLKRRGIRRIDQEEYIKEKERSIKGFEKVLREKHSEKTVAFVREELRVAQKKMSEMKANLAKTHKDLDLAYSEKQRFLEKTFGTPCRGESCVYNGEIRTVLQYGKYHFVEVKKFK